jgi:uncharacterized protein (DUF1697 family)
MALIAFLRGVNVGGHRTFRPSLVARALRAYDVVNVGAAGTFVVRAPGSRAAFRAALGRALPFEATIALCEGRALLRLIAEDPFRAEPPRPDVVRFVSVLPRAVRRVPALPVTVPAAGDWCVRVLDARGQFVCGVYRRQMRAIGALGTLDALFGQPATTRSWGTIEAVARLLEER